MATTTKGDKATAMNGFPATSVTARWLALGAVAGPILLTLAWIVLGLMRPATKNEWGVSGGITGMITQPFSGLGLGPNGSLFNAAFLLSGILTIVGVFGVFQIIGPGERPALGRAGATLLALSGLGGVVCGVFTLESFVLHMTGVILGIGGPILGFLATGFFLRDIPRWRRFGNWLFLGSPLTLVAGAILPYIPLRHSVCWAWSGRTDRAHLGHRDPSLVRGHGLAGLPPPRAGRTRAVRFNRIVLVTPITKPVQQ